MTAPLQTQRRRTIPAEGATTRRLERLETAGREEPAMETMEPFNSAGHPHPLIIILRPAGPPDISLFDSG